MNEKEDKRKGKDEVKMKDDETNLRKGPTLKERKILSKKLETRKSMLLLVSYFASFTVVCVTYITVGFFLPFLMKRKSASLMLWILVLLSVLRAREAGFQVLGKRKVTSSKNALPSVASKRRLDVSLMTFLTSERTVELMPLWKDTLIPVYPSLILMLLDAWVDDEERNKKKNNVVRRSILMQDDIFLV